MGHFAPSPITVSTPGVSASYGPGSPPLGASGLLDLRNPQIGPWAFVYTSEDLETAHTGARLALFFDDWYFRVHLIPGVLSLGSFSETTTKNFTTWNAYLTGINLTAKAFGDGTMELTEGFSIPPVSFNPLQPIVSSITAAKNGPEVISDSLVLTFDTGEVRTLGINGLRVIPPDAVLWPYPPNWSSSFDIEYAFKTDIITSRRGNQQRRALRRMPRKKIAFSNIVKPSQLQAFRKMISRSHKATFIVPEYPRYTASTADISNSLTMDVESVPAWIAADVYVVLRHNGVMASRQVKSVVGTTVTFWTLDGLDWPAGTKIHPGLVCELPENFAVKRVTSEVNTYRVTFEVVPGSEPVEDYGVPDDVFDGRELFLKRPNWASAQDSVLMQPSELVDYGYGVRSRTFPIPFPTYRITQAFVGRNFEEAESLRRFVGRMRGQQGEMYLAMKEDALSPSVDLDPDPAEAWLRTDGNEDYLAYKDNTTRRAILVTLTDGTQLYRVVASIEFVSDGLGNSTRFNLTEAWPYAITVAEIENVCWVPLWRLSSDVYTERWRTSSVMETQITFETLERQEQE